MEKEGAPCFDRGGSVPIIQPFMLGLGLAHLLLQAWRNGTGRGSSPAVSRSQKTH